MALGPGFKFLGSCGLGFRIPKLPNPNRKLSSSGFEGKKLESVERRGDQ